MCKVMGIGTDLCAISRMQPNLTNAGFLSRCFTPAEIEWIRSRGAAAADSLAGLWAAKEAALKALGTGLTVSMRDIEIVHTSLGQPQPVLHGKAAALVGSGRLMISISHEGDMACAFCVWEGEA